MPRRRVPDRVKEAMPIEGAPPGGATKLLTLPDCAHVRPQGHIE